MDGFLESFPSPALWQEFIERTCFNSFFLSFLSSLFSSFLSFHLVVAFFPLPPLIVSQRVDRIRFEREFLEFQPFFCATEEHGIVARFVVNDYAAF